MLVHVPEVLSKAQIAEIRAALDRVTWSTGDDTVGAPGQAKFGQQLAKGSEVGRRLGATILQQLQQKALFVTAALPHKIYPPLFNRYAEGMLFDRHINNAIRHVPGVGAQVRTDIACTLFLSEPEEYEGGELLVEDTYGVKSAKLPAGDLVLYPCASLSRVNPVTRGARLASFFWVQSLVRNDSERALLFDLDLAIQRVAADHPDHASVVPLTNVYHNLLRRLAET